MIKQLRLVLWITDKPQSVLQHFDFRLVSGKAPPIALVASSLQVLIAHGGMFQGNTHILTALNHNLSFRPVVHNWFPRPVP